MDVIGFLQLYEYYHTERMKRVVQVVLLKQGFKLRVDFLQVGVLLAMEGIFLCREIKRIEGVQFLLGNDNCASHSSYTII